MKHRFFCLLVALSLVITSSVSAKQPQRGLSVVSNSNTWGKYHALIIGINNYKEWPRLRTAVKDATVIRDTLVSRYGFDKRNVILRTDQKASRLQIIQDLRYLAQSMHKDDNLFIYYAGHGQLDDFTGDGYWVPAEGRLKNPGTWLANSYIKAVISSEKLQAKNVVIIADSCYSGSMLRGGPSLMSLEDQRYREKLAQKAALRSRQVISSGGVEPVTDGGAEGHSLFAYYLIEALRKNNREVIDLENLFHTKVWKPVTEIGNQRPNVGRLKTPMDQDGQFVLYNAALAQSKALPLDPRKNEAILLTGTTTRIAPQTINAEEEMWKIVQSSTSIEDFMLFLDEYPNSRFRGAAKLKIQQLKRKQNAMTMTAVVAPAVVKPKSAKLVSPSVVAHAGVVASEGNYIKYSTGIVYDKKTNLEWYVGPDENTSLHQADKWVKSLDIDGGGWRLPTEKELRSIYTPKTGKRNMSPLLKTTGTWVWSGPVHRSGNVLRQKAQYFGGRPKSESMAMTSTLNMRAFAVRSPKEVAQVKSETKKPNALYASATPVVVDQSDLRSQRKASNNYTLALFPIKVLSEWGRESRYQKGVVKTAASISEDDDRLEFKLSYKEIKDLPDGVRLFPDNANLEENQVWIKKTMFSKYEPDWEQIKKAGLKIDVDLAILFFLDVGMHSTVDIYLYDYRHAKTYSRIDNNIGYKSINSGVKQNLLRIMKDYFRHQ